jgi:Tol biopolymer transport system component
VRFAVLLICWPVLAEFSPEDLTKIRDIAELRVSPDGKTLLFRVREKLIRMPAAGGEAAEIAGAPSGASQLRWSPDGKRVAFLAQKGVWTFDTSADRFTRLCDHDRGNSFLSNAGSMLAWSPDGTRIAFAGTLEPVSETSDPLVISRILYKSRTALSDNRRTHIYTVPASGGAPRALTSGEHDEHSISWGAGGEIVFSRIASPTRTPTSITIFSL